VVSDLAKPLDYYAFWLSRDAGRAVYHTLFWWLPTVRLGVPLRGQSRIPPPARRRECGNIIRVTAVEALPQRCAARGSPGWICPAMANVKTIRTNQEEGMDDGDCGYGEIYV
jgi:hypothetical protein